MILEGEFRLKIFKKAILPSGFQASAAAAGIKRSGKPDLALLYSAFPAKAALLSTTNRIQAAPILLNKAHSAKSKGCRAIIVNSGNANSFTGRQGLLDAQAIAKELARDLKIKKESVLVASTGIIGRRLPLLKIKSALPGLVDGLSAEGLSRAAQAILTTDTFTKEITVKFNLGSRVVSVCGIAKGAGMIAPNMATMLSFVLTDARVTQGALNKALRLAADSSFNCITVDGCMSTNDTIIALANGRAQNKLIEQSVNFDPFLKALHTVCLELAKMIIRDAEGASKFIEIEVAGAKTPGQARQAALGVANSSLFKTAVYGEDPNFGRIVAAVGSSGAEVREQDIRIKVSSLRKRDVRVEVDLKQGKAGCTVYTSDLTPEYIKINAEYN